MLSINPLLLNIGYSELNANWNWQGIYSPFARIYYVVKGNAQTKINDILHDLEEGYIYIIPPFTTHDDICNSEFSLIYIHFHDEPIERISIFDRYEFPFKTEASKIDILLFQRLLDINPNRALTHHDPSFYDNTSHFNTQRAYNNKISAQASVETKGILTQFISRFLDTVKLKTINNDNRILDSLDIIQNNISENISISQLANIACLSKDHYIRLFKKDTGETPTKYINRRKIETAQFKLITSEDSIMDVAFSLSIENISYLNRLLKEATYMTPT